MTVIEEGHYCCQRLYSEQQTAGTEQAIARVENYHAEKNGDPESIAITSLRLAYAIKLWETKYRQQMDALLGHNQLLRNELNRAHMFWNDGHDEK